MSRTGRRGAADPAGIVIEPCASVQQQGWLPLRRMLWPDDTDEQHLAEMASFVAQPNRYAQFVAYDESRRPIGFVEASIRKDHVNGTETSPVAFLEGIYVLPEHRQKGIARDLVEAVSKWSVARGCSELASDAALDNELSHVAHRGLGFTETERVVYFRKNLPAGTTAPAPEARARGWWRRNWKWAAPAGVLAFAAVTAAMVLWVALFVSSAMRGSGAYREALAMARSNSDVVESIGEPVEAGWLVLGSINLNGASGSAELAIPILGPRGKGTLHVLATKEAGLWEIDALQFVVKGRSEPIDLLRPTRERASVRT